MVTIRGLILAVVIWTLSKFFDRLEVTPKSHRKALDEHVSDLKRRLRLAQDHLAVLDDKYVRSLAAAFEAEADRNTWGKKSDRLVDALDKIKTSKTHNQAVALAACALRGSVPARELPSASRIPL